MLSGRNKKYVDLQNQKQNCCKELIKAKVIWWYHDIVILTFSLMMLSGRTQSASCFWRDPDGPNFWKVHFATWKSHWYQIQIFLQFQGFTHLWKDSVEGVVSHIDWFLHLWQHVPAHIALHILDFCIVFCFTKIQIKLLHLGQHVPAHKIDAFVLVHSI